jgi:hypothetical protein
MYFYKFTYILNMEIIGDLVSSKFEFPLTLYEDLSQSLTLSIPIDMITSLSTNAQYRH